MKHPRHFVKETQNVLEWPQMASNGLDRHIHSGLILGYAGATLDIRAPGQ
jgi:hypothetical protein